MRKSRLIILPARCLAKLGFLLLYLSCPILADMSRGTPDSGLAASFQLQVLEHCASPPEDPGDGGCPDLRNDLMKTTWPDNPDTEPTATCSNLDVFKLDNTCSSDENARYARKKPRRLLAARYTETPQEAPKIQLMKRPVKFRSLKRNQQVEELQSTERRTARTSAERRSAVYNDVSRLAERRANRRSNEMPLYGRVSERDTTRRTATTRILYTDDRDTSRRPSTDRQSSKRISSAVQQSRYLTEERSLQRIPSDRRTLESDANRRISVERDASRKSFDRRIQDTALYRSVGSIRQHTRKSTDSRVSDSYTARQTNDPSTRRVSERKMITSESSRTSVERRSSRVSAEREMPVTSRVGVLGRTDSESDAAKTINRSTAERRLADLNAFRRMSNERHSSQSTPSERRLETRSLQIRAVERRQHQKPTSEIRFTDSRTSDAVRMSGTERRLSRKSEPITSETRRSRINASQQKQSERTNILRRSIRSASLDRLTISQRRVPEDRQTMRMSAKRLSTERRDFAESNQRVYVQERRVSARDSNDRESARSFDVRLTRRTSIERRDERYTDRRLPERRISEERRSTRSYHEGLRPRLSSERSASEERRNLRTHREKSFTRTSAESLGSLRKSEERSRSNDLVRMERRTLRIPRNANSERHTLEVLISTSSRNTDDDRRVSLIRSSTRTSAERIADARHSKKDIDSSASRDTTRRSSDRLILNRNSNDRVKSLRDSGNRMSSRKSTKNIASIGVTSARFEISRNSRENLLRLTPSKESSIRIITTDSKERLSNSKTYEQSVKRSTFARNSQSSNTERLADTRMVRGSLERTPFEKDTRRYSVQHVGVNRDSRTSSDRSTMIRNTRDRAVNSRSERRLSENTNVNRNSRSNSIGRLSEIRRHRSAELTAAARSFRSTSVERLADTRRDRKSTEKATAFRESKALSAESLLSRNDRRYRLADITNIRRTSTERISGRRGERVETLRRSKNMYSERLALANNRLSATSVARKLSSDRLATSRDSEVTIKRSRNVLPNRSITAGRIVSSRDSGSSERLGTYRDFRRTSVDQRGISEEREKLERVSASTRSNAHTTARRTRSSPNIRSKRESTMTEERRLAKDSRSSLERTHLQGESRQSLSNRILERSYIRDSRSKSSDRVSGPKNVRSIERLNSVRDSVARLAETRASRRSTERVAIRKSRSSTTQASRESRRSVKVVSTIRDTRGDSSERLELVRNNRMSTRRLADTKDSRISSDSANEIRISRRTLASNLAVLRNSRISSRQTTVRDSRKSPEQTHGDSRRSVDSLTGVRDSRRFSSERSVSTLNSRISSERMAFIRDSREMFENGVVRRIKRNNEQIAFNRNPRVSSERLSSYRNTERAASIDRDRRSTERLGSIRNSRIIPAEQLGMSRSSTRSTERMAEYRDFSRNSVDRRQLSRATDRLRISTQRYTSESRAETGRNVRRSNNRLVNVRERRHDVRIETRRIAERLSSERLTRSERRFHELDSRQTTHHSLNRDVRTMISRRRSDVNRSSVRRNAIGDFRRTSSERIQTERNLRRSMEQFSSLRDITNTRLLTSASRRSFSRFVHMTNLRISADSRNSDRMVLERQSMSTEEEPSRHRQSQRGVSSSTIHAASESVSNFVQNNFIDERQLNNVTLKTDLLSGIGLSVGAILNLKDKTWHSIFLEHLETILASFISLMWPVLTLWKTSFANSLMDMDSASMLPSRMDHINSFFTDKLSPHYALVPENLATKSISPISREGASILTSAIGGGATAAFACLALRSK